MKIQHKLRLINRLRQILFLSGMFSIYGLQGQDYTPLELTKKIFSSERFPDIAKYCAGEFKGHPNGKDLQKGTRTVFRLLEQKDSTAVVAITFLDKDGRGFDGYLHFEKAEIWKVTAFRALAMTGLIEMSLLELEKMTIQQVDEWIAKTKGMESDNGVIRSRDDYYFQLGNARLILALDDSIIQHFLNNRLAFEQLKELAMQDQHTDSITSRKGQKLLLGHRAACQKLFISAVYSKSDNKTVLLDFFIGGMIDNTVGYFYTNDINSLPKMDDRRYIMIREIRDGWYVYKTT